MADHAARWALLVAVAAAALSWLGCTALLASGGTLPALGASAWLPLALLAGGVGWLWASTRRSLRDAERRPDADVAVTRVRIGAASALAGAAASGIYGVLAGFGVAGWPAPLAVGRAVQGGVAAVVAGAWSVFGVLLVRACRLPRE